MKRKNETNEEKQKEDVTLCGLPEEILLKIFGLVGVTDLLSINRVNRKLGKLTHDEFLWKPYMQTFMSKDRPALWKFAKISFFNLREKAFATVSYLHDLLIKCNTDKMEDFYSLFLKAIDISNFSPLFLAKILVEEKVPGIDNVNSTLRGLKEQTLFHCFASTGDIGVVDYFISSNFDLKIKDADEKTPLDLFFSYSKELSSSVLEKQQVQNKHVFAKEYYTLLNKQCKPLLETLITFDSNLRIRIPDHEMDSNIYSVLEKLEIMIRAVSENLKDDSLTEQYLKESKLLEFTRSQVNRWIEQVTKNESANSISLKSNQ